MNNEAFSNIIDLGKLEIIAADQYNLPFTIIKSSDILAGHFPDQPILPGVIMIELTKRAAEKALNKKLKLVSAGNFKFLKMVNPNVLDSADFSFLISIAEKGWRLKATINYKDEIYFKADAYYEQQ